MTVPYLFDTIQRVNGARLTPGFQLAKSDSLVRTMEHSLARWVTYHLAAAAGIFIACIVLAALIVGPFLFRVVRGSFRVPAPRAPRPTARRR